ncbi:MAG: hypothetical protein ACI4C7_09795 [Clostridia bacterium]
MENDIFNKFNLTDMPHIMNPVSVIQTQIEEDNKKNIQIAEEAYNNRQRMQQAVEKTAVNTEQTNVQLQNVVENQNAYIDILKEQLSIQKQQLEFDEQQLNILKNIFASEEDGVAVEKEIMKLIQKQIDSSHPLWDYVKDKGGDIAVAGITNAIPIIYPAFKAFLASKGIMLP